MEYIYLPENLQNYNIVKDILKWNDGKNIIVWPYNMEKIDIHKDLLNVFVEYIYNIKNIPGLYKIKIDFIENREYKKFILDSLDNIDEYNIFLSNILLEDITDPFLKIKNENLNIFCNNINKEILIFEVHIPYNNILSHFNYLKKSWEMFLSSNLIK